ncbi:MAG: SDR family NAD(P)-dependent oxidoreductase [Actinomycetota bacterium]
MGAFDGKVALVTGAASGIGKAVATRLARDGASVVVADVDEDGGPKVAADIGGTFAHTDVGDLEQNRAAVATTLDRYGRLDIAHLNAGVTTGETDIRQLTEDAYRRAVGINLDGVVFGTMAAAPNMTDGGRIIATASLAGLVPYPGDVVYGLTKHAVVGFVRSMSEQLAPKGITINAVCPGFVDTPILGPFAEEFKKAGFPLLTPDDVAEAVVSIIESSNTGDVFISQPGRISEPYRFRGVPGPRTEGAEGLAPPVRPGFDAGGVSS